MSQSFLPRVCRHLLAITLGSFCCGALAATSSDGLNSHGGRAEETHLPPSEVEAVLSSTEAKKPPGPREIIQETLRHSEQAPAEPVPPGLVSKMELARRQRAEGKLAEAARVLVEVLKTVAPEEVHRTALLELAGVVEAEGLLPRAQQIYAQYAARYFQHPTVLEVYLRQGEIYRRMGVTSLAIARFYLVMTGALGLKVDQLEQYQRLVLQAQIEIADTHYLDGRWADANDFLSRLLKLDSPYLDRRVVLFKLVRALAHQDRLDQTAAQAELFLSLYPEAPEVPEVRFLLANALKQQGRSEDALRQVVLLLESQRGTAGSNPESWAYWQKRAGNEIGNQLYREGDYLGTLQIYERLAQLDSSVAWQAPVWYQMGLAYERLQQPAKAGEMYAQVLQREAEATGTNATPNLRTVVEMARWRRDNLTWLQNATATAAALCQTKSPDDTPHTP